MTFIERVNKFEALYAAYIAKLARLDELKAKGRYGYQLRMPKKSLSIAIANLRQFGQEQNIEIASLLN
jgi:hypothetical protein